MTPQRLENRKAVIVGASRGIGNAIARGMTDEGAAAALIARSANELTTTCDEINEGGGSAAAIVADCTIASEARHAIEMAEVELGGVDIVVNAQGVHPVWSRIGEMPIDSWDETIAVNLSSVFYVCRAALPRLVENGGGAIVNITSVGAFRAWRLVGPYTASKAGVELMTRNIAIEYAADGVRANTVAPGVIDAGITDDVIARDPKARAVLEGMHPVERLGQADEVVEATIWLASDASSFTTGATLTVDGGFLA